MSGVLRLSNNVTGRSTIIASASNDQTFTLPAIGGTLLVNTSSQSQQQMVVLLVKQRMNLT
jgi:hypothetical protein